MHKPSIMFLPRALGDNGAFGGLNEGAIDDNTMAKTYTESQIFLTSTKVLSIFHRVDETADLESCRSHGEIERLITIREIIKLKNASWIESMGLQNLKPVLPPILISPLFLLTQCLQPIVYHLSTDKTDNGSLKPFLHRND